MALAWPAASAAGPRQAQGALVQGPSGLRLRLAAARSAAHYGAAAAAAAGAGPVPRENSSKAAAALAAYIKEGPPPM